MAEKPRPSEEAELTNGIVKIVSLTFLLQGTKQSVQKDEL